VATFGNLQKYLARDSWIEEPNLARGHRRIGDHWRYRKDLPDGTTLRTKVSHSLGAEIGVALFKHILRDQLQTSEDRFWAVVRGVAPLSEPPPPQARTIPGWLVQRLLVTMGLREDEIRAMTADEAQAAWVAYQARPK
jgi:hypothetical protein